MKKRKKKNKIKLKTNVKLFLIIVLIVVVVFNIGKNKYEDYLYTKTSDYKLNEIGYTTDEVNIISSKLNDEEKWHIANDIGLNEFIINFIKSEYFIPKNLDEYLKLTVSKEDDFWHYKKPDTYNYDELVTKVNVKINNEFYTETVPTDMSKGYGIIVNKYHYLSNDYIPDDLVYIDWKYRFGGEKSTIQIRSEVYEAFKNMWADANQAGFYLMVESGFRTYDYQKKIYDNYANKKGISYADSIAARPGYSEHQTGLALDIYSKSCSVASEFKNTEVYKWLLNNSYKYGFILRYPEKKEKVTGYNFESWHYRYVGVELASKMHESGLTFDEYYAFYLE